LWKSPADVRSFTGKRFEVLSIGMEIETFVPLPGELLTWYSPSIRFTLSIIDLIPDPAELIAVSTSKPLPLSSIVNIRFSISFVILSSTSEAPEYFAALFNDSCTIL